MCLNERYKLIFEKICNLPLTNYQLENIKLQYKNTINSIRLMDYINNLRDLLDILEKRNYFGPNNLTPMFDIANLLDVGDDIYNIFDKNTTSSEISSIKKQKIYKLLAQDIGKKWQNFARALDIREGQIDDLCNMYPSINDRIYKILQLHEEQCDSQSVWINELLNALSIARHNDLRKRVEIILEIENI